jgi:hypothetical protein
MKIVQSFWTKPVVNSYDKLDGGWPDKKYHFISWALSCLLLKEHYQDVELYTDDFGKYLLIDRLGIPYTKVHTSLNYLDKYDTGLWMIGKIYTYSLQHDPFIHVDSDIFLWERFGEGLETAPLLAQDIERSYETYLSYIVDAEGHFRYVPDSFRSESRRMRPYASCYNTGIAGGCDTAFIRRYADEALQFSEKNYPFIPDQTDLKRLFGTLAEQYLLYSMATQEGIAASVLIEDYYHFSLNKDIRKTARMLKYVHLMGGRNGGYKSDACACSVMENWLRKGYPEYYYRIKEAVCRNIV